MFKVTPQAAEQVKTAAQQGGTPGMALRLAAQQRPDAGNQLTEAERLDDVIVSTQFEAQDLVDFLTLSG